MATIPQTNNRVNTCDHSKLWLSQDERDRAIAARRARIAARKDAIAARQIDIALFTASIEADEKAISELESQYLDTQFEPQFTDESASAALNSAIEAAGLTYIGTAADGSAQFVQQAPLPRGGFRRAGGAR